METHPDGAAAEIKRLQRCINDLVSVVALPAVWTGTEPSQIVRTLLDVLLSMLDLDFAYVRLSGSIGEQAIEMARAARSGKLPAGPQEIGGILNNWLGPEPQNWAPRVRNSVGDGDISIVPLLLGLHGDIGVIVVGSQRPDFPGQIERLVLSVAANQAAIGLQEARLLGEQKRVAGELDRRVTQRTAELAATNEELRKEIAERKLAEEALRVSERQIQLLVNSIPAPIAVMTAAGEVETVNGPVLEYFGKTLEELKNWTIVDAVHPDDLPHTVASWARAIETGLPYEIQSRHRRADGVYRWFHVRGFPLLDTNGRILRWCVLQTDINDRKHAEEQLRRSEAFLAEAQRLSLTGSFSWRVDTDQISFSGELQRIFELERDAPVTFELIGARVHPEDVPLLSEKIELARSGISDLEYEIRLRMPDGRVKYVRTIARGIRRQDGRPEYIGAVQDVTERRLSEEALGKIRAELAHATRITSLGAMTASIAHEINQPLAGIVTNASTCVRMLAADPPNVEGALRTAQRTICDGNRASEVVARLRALFAKNTTMTDTVDLNEATREVITLSFGELQRAGVILRPEFADGLPPVTGDRVQLQQVILNLLLNASDAMSGLIDRPRQLVIRTEPEEDDHVRLTVQDAGVGIDPQHVERIFEAFYSTKSSGMGIGLFVSRSIIENHNGRLWAEPNDGPGAKFLFSIPRLPESVMSVRSPDPGTLSGTAS